MKRLDSSRRSGGSMRDRDFHNSLSVLAHERGWSNVQLMRRIQRFVKARRLQGPLLTYLRRMAKQEWLARHARAEVKP